jgi:dienelactone hydrolase
MRTAIPPIPWVAFALVAISIAKGQPAPDPPGSPPYTEIFYRSGPLRIEAYLYKPAGDGPFPLVLYNHGSRDGQDRVEQPVPFIGRLFTRAGYAVLVPERRGYGKSDGRSLREEIGFDTSGKLLDRLRAETLDVMAALEYARTEPAVDTSRVGIMGWSFGGIISVFAARHSDKFFAVVDQAGGALTWQKSQALQSALRDAGRDAKAPLLCMDAENDATTDAVKEVCRAARERGTSAELRIYPPFTPSQNPSHVAPGHLLFTGQGVTKWGQDVVTFFETHRPR